MARVPGRGPGREGRPRADPRGRGTRGRRRGPRPPPPPAIPPHAQVPRGEESFSSGEGRSVRALLHPRRRRGTPHPPTPFPRRRCSGDITRMQYLLQSGTSPNEANPRGVTPLHLAVAHEQLDAITLLLDHGADPRTKNSVGKSALDVAADRGKLGRRTLTLVRGARQPRPLPERGGRAARPFSLPATAVGSSGGRSPTSIAPRRRRSRQRRRRRRTACWRRSRTRPGHAPRRSCGR